MGRSRPDFTASEPPLRQLLRAARDLRRDMDESHKHIQRAARHLRKAKQAYPGFLDFNLDLEPPSEDWLYQYLDDKGTDYVDHQ